MAAAFTIAGGIIGGMVGAPNVGILVGSIIGNLLFPPKGQDTVGPRLSDLKIQSSTYGTGLPTVYGHSRLTGNIIFSTEKQEHEHKKQQSMKGAGPTVTDYTYTITCAIALCEGPILGVPRIRANGKLIYNVSKEASTNTIIASGLKAKQIRFYNGSADQLPDPSIEAYAGRDNVSAYRGTAYVVFEDLDITEWGTLPNLEFEVIANGQPEVKTSSINVPNKAIISYLDSRNAVKPYFPTIKTIFCRSESIKDTCRCLIQYSVKNGNNTIDKIDVIDMSTENIQFIKNLSTNIQNWGISCSAGDSYYTYETNSIIDGVQWKYKYIYDPVNDVSYLTYKESTNKEKSGIDLVSSVYKNTFQGQDKNNIDDYAFYSLNGGALSYLGKIKKHDGDNVRGLQYTDDYIYDSYFTGIIDGEYHIQIDRYRRNDYTFIDVFYKGLFLDLKFPYNDYYVFNTTFNGSFKLFSDGRKEPFCVNGFIVDYKYDILYNFSQSFNGNYFFGYIGYFTTQDTIRRGPTTLVPANGSVSLATIISDQFVKSGQSTSLIDVSSLTDIKVPGYIISRKDAIKSNIERLLQLYFVDTVESDGVIKFVRRGGNVVTVIPESDLSVHGYGGEKPDNMVIERVQNIDLPTKINVTYMDIDGGFQIGTQYASRQATNGLQNIKSVEAAITLKADDAKLMAIILLQDSWQSRNTVSIILGRKYSYLEPTDIIKVYKYGDLYTLRIIDCEEQDGVYNFKCVTEDITKYTQEAIGAPLPKPEEEIKTVYKSNINFLDIPLLRDQDDHKGLYLATYGDINNKKWGGCTLYQSNDGGATYTPYKTTSIAAEAGYAVSDLGDFKGGYKIDNLNYVDVAINAEIYSVEDTALFNGVNLALLGNEIIQFKNATLIGTNTYRLSGLIRGKFGTEKYKSNHSYGERFIMLDNGTIDMLYLNSDDYDKTKIFKAVSFGQYETDVSPSSFTFNAKAQECYSPVQLGGGRDNNGNALLKWIRRGRINNSWNDKIDVPLGEEINEFEIDIIDSNNNVVRTLKTSDQFISYTAEDQIADFKSIQNKINFNVYQMSADRGRGFPAIGVI